MRRRRDGSNSSSPERNKRTAVDSFSASKPFVLEPHHIWWTALATLVLPYAELYSPEFVLNVLQVLFRETLDVRPSSWEEIEFNVCKEECGRKSREGEVLDFRIILHRYALKLKDPMAIHKLMMEDSKKIGLAGAQPGERFVATKRSWFGIYLRRCRLAYMKLSEAALTRLHKALMEWLDGKPIACDLSTEIVEEPGYNLIPTFLDTANPGTTDSYESFEHDAHVGDVAGAVDNLRRYFDQRFTPGKQPPRQHVLNALVHYSLKSGEIETARLMCSEAMNIARTVRDRRTLMDVTSLARRLPPKPLPTFHDDTDGSRRRQALAERDAEQAKLNPQRYTVIQQGTSPLDLLFDIRLGINEGESISFLFRKCFEAVGAFDLPPELHIWPLDMQWEICAVDAKLWRLAGQATVAEIGEDIVLRNANPGSEIRLYTLCARARQHFQRGQYVKAFGTLFDGETWSHLSLVQYQYWSNEIWHLMWDLATRRRQETFKRQFLESKKPKVSRFETAETGKKSPESIRKLIIEASEALTARDLTRATIMIIDALHYAEVNHYWYLYRSAVPVFADLELQRGKIQSARHVLEQILPQVARGEDLEQRALVYTVYAKVKMAQGKGGDHELLKDAIVYLKWAQADYTALEMYASVQDVLYLQAVVNEALGSTVERDHASRDLFQMEEMEKKMMQGHDTEMMELWDVVCEVGVAVASGDTHWL